MYFSSSSFDDDYEHFRYFKILKMSYAGVWLVILINFRYECCKEIKFETLFELVVMKLLLVVGNYLLVTVNIMEMSYNRELFHDVAALKFIRKLSHKRIGHWLGQ